MKNQIQRAGEGNRRCWVRYREQERETEDVEADAESRRGKQKMNESDTESRTGKQKMSQIQRAGQGNRR